MKMGMDADTLRAQTPTDGAEGVAALRERLREAEATLDAIRNGDVDAIVVGGPSGQQVYTLENADRPYRVLVEQMQEGALSLGGDGTVLYCNERFAAILGVARAAIIGNGVGRFLSQPIAEVIRALLSQPPGSVRSGEYALRRGDGSDVYVNISLVNLKVDAAAPQILCGVVTDLTLNRRRSVELIEANAQLASEVEERRRAEDSLQLTLEAAGLGIWAMDPRTGAMRGSAGHDRIFGLTEAQAGWTLEKALEQFPEGNRAAVREAFVRAERSGSIEFEERIRRVDDGTTRWVHVKGRTYYEDGKAIRIAGVIADTTNRREVDELLRQSQKMEAVGQLTGGIAHDFNNLLMIVGGSIEMLKKHVAPDQRTTRLLDAARQAVNRGAKLNEQLLAFSRRQDLQTEAVQVNELIPTFEHLLDRALGETIAVEFQPSTLSWHCRTDSHQLETAILNLVINARDAMPNGGLIVIRTDCRFVPVRSATPWGGKAGDYVVVSVKDSGTGVPPEILARVFEPFFTTKEIGRGTGLGLSQVYGFAKQSGGFVAIDSEVGRGTVVSIHLPRVAPPPPAGKVDGNEAAAIGQREGTVLVVEDDPDVRQVALGMLRELGYEGCGAESGQAALDILATGTPVDLVFSDVIMAGGISGTDLAVEISRRWPDLPVLLTSGYTAQRLIPDALAESVGVLRKPYALQELAKALAGSIRPRPKFA